MHEGGLPAVPSRLTTNAEHATMDTLRVACQRSTFALRATVDNLHLACQPKLAPCNSASKRRLVAQIFPRWNPLTSWMREIESFQKAAEGWFAKAACDYRTGRNLRDFGPFFIGNLVGVGCQMMDIGWR